MKWNKLYNYPNTIRSSVDGVRKYSINDEKLPSVTTILKATESEDKKESLARWRRIELKILLLYVVLLCIPI